jgi:hypothetical protein
MTVFARAQYLAGADGIDPATRAITPTAATSILVAVLSERSGVGSTPHAVSDGGATGGDWVKAVGHDQALGDSNARHSFSVWWKVAGSTAAITVSGDDGTGNGKRLSVHEYTTDTAGTWSVVGTPASADTGTGSSSPLAIGPTGSAAAGDNLVVAFINWRTAGDQAYPGTATNSFTGLTTTGAVSNARQHGTAWKQDASGGTFSTSIDWTGTGHEAAGAIVVFALGAGGGGPDETAPILSAATLTATSDTASTGGVTTDEAGPAWAVATSSATQPSTAQVKAGQDHTGATAPSDTATLAVGANPGAFAFTGQTTSATYYMHVVQDDEADPANTSAVESSAGEVIVAPSTITVNCLDFAEGSNIRMRMALAAGLRTGGCTLIWREKRRSQDVYSGGHVFSDGTGSWDSGAWTVLFVTHGSDGTFDATGQRLVGGGSNPMYHEIAGMDSAAYGSANDYIASNSGLGTQVSYLVQEDVWVERAATINVNGSLLEHVSYVDFSDPTKVIRQNLATSDPVTPTNQYLDFGAPHWITNGSEDFDGQVTHLKVFSRALSTSEIRQELDNFSDTPVVSDCWYSNYSPTAADITDKKPSGPAHPFAWHNGTATDTTAEFDLPAVVSATASMSSGAATLAAVGLLALSALASMVSGASSMAAQASLQVAGSVGMSSAPAAVSATGLLPIAATTGMSTTPSTMASSATLPVAASAGMSSAPASVQGVGVLPISSAVSMTTGPATVVASGTLGSAVAATASMGTSAAQVSAAAVLPIQAAASMTSGASVMAAAANLPVAGTVGMSSAPAGVSAVGALSIGATSAMSSTPATMSADGGQYAGPVAAASMSSTPATVSAQGLLTIAGTAGMQSASAVLQALGFNSVAITWPTGRLDPAHRAIVPAVNLRAIVPFKGLRAIVPQE